MAVPTHTFRNIVRLAVDKVHRDYGVQPHIMGAWTDERSLRNEDADGSERVVTYQVLQKEVRVFDEVKRLMDAVGLDWRSHGVRLTMGGYIKCNCVLSNAKFI